MSGGVIFLEVVFVKIFGNYFHGWKQNKIVEVTKIYKRFICIKLEVWKYRVMGCFHACARIYNNARAIIEPCARMGHVSNLPPCFHGGFV